MKLGAACLEFTCIFREWLLQLQVQTSGRSNKHYFKFSYAMFLTFLKPHRLSCRLITGGVNTRAGSFGSVKTFVSQPYARS